MIGLHLMHLSVHGCNSRNVRVLPITRYTKRANILCTERRTQPQQHPLSHLRRAARRLKARRPLSQCRIREPSSRESSPLSGGYWQSCSVSFCFVHGAATGMRRKKQLPFHLPQQRCSRHQRLSRSTRRNGPYLDQLTSLSTRHSRP